MLAVAALTLTMVNPVPAQAQPEEEGVRLVSVGSPIFFPQAMTAVGEGEQVTASLVGSSDDPKQRWVVEPVEGNSVWIRQAQTDLCLEASAHDSILLIPCHLFPPQQWQMREPSDGQRDFVNLEIPGVLTYMGPGEPLALTPFQEFNSSQQWMTFE
ncbi:RICIN domain-containing protein [Nocardiopsis sp. NPDC050513]|uniref:RICIN domain-containing protein n=1 Tax=Nocardiopsis sp. NPDC050513 TaxID=3364338 RepID=UPI0037A5AD62